VSRWSDHGDVERGADYDARWARLEGEGTHIHGEADLIEALLCDVVVGPAGGAVLDAGCGTGRVAIELSRRRVEVVGVDLDPTMLDVARAKGPLIDWHLADLSTLELSREFDVVAAPGNVMIFLEPGTEAVVVGRLAAHVRPGGHLVVGFRVAVDLLPLDHYDGHAADAGLEPVHRWATWDREPYAGGDYAVSVHRCP
jgi:2-polyprenyl-3-methyl-5-hydroxy-6-metoxy-1,4-benzoquinol methylase